MHYTLGLSADDTLNNTKDKSQDKSFFLDRSNVLIKRTYESKNYFSCFTSLFTNFQAGTVPAGILSMIASMIGSGFLILPVIGRNNGYLVSAILITNAVMISMIGNLQLGIAYRATKRNNYA